MKLHYYKAWNTGGFNTQLLLAGKDGNCFAWSRLFAYSLQNAGVQTEIQEAEVWPTKTYGPLANKRKELFLVNNWYFNPDLQGASGVELYPWVNMPKYASQPDISWELVNDNPATWDSVWAPGEAATDLYGVSGQNVPNPLSTFLNHCMVQINGVLYDPSHGKTFANREQWVNESVAAYMVQDWQFGRFLIRSNPGTVAAAQDETELKLRPYNGS